MKVKTTILLAFVFLAAVASAQSNTCAYTFTYQKANFRFCVTSSGTLGMLQSPIGVDHLDPLNPVEGWSASLSDNVGGGEGGVVIPGRVPIAGGPPQLVLTASPRVIHSLRCARSPATLCAIAERTPDHKQLIFTAFDPVKGRGHELTRFSTSPTPDAEYAWDLSPDGTGIAVLRRSEATIHVLSLSHQPSREIVVKAPALPRPSRLQDYPQPL